MFSYKKYIKGLKNQVIVIDALLYRELLTKKSYSFLGFLGVIIEPLLITLVYLLILKLIRFRLDLGMNTILFFATGLLIYSFFISIISRSSNAIKANKNLFYYKKVKPIDTVIARSFIEISLVIAVYFLILSIVFYAENKVILENLPILLLVFILITIFSFSIGLILIILINNFEFIKNIIPLLSRPLFFTSGAIFPLKRVPDEFQKFVLWNPILHANELARNALDSNYIIYQEVSLNFLSYVTLISFGIAIYLYKNNEKALLRR